MIISVAHTKGGVGKSTISYNLATTLKKNFDVEIIDLDFQKTTTYINNLRSEKKRMVVKSFDDTAKLQRYLDGLEDDKLVIFDVGGFDSAINRLAILYSDLVITPVSDSPTEILGLLKFHKILEELEEKIEDDIEVKILFNQIDYRKKDFEELEDFIGGKKNFSILESVLRQRSTYKKATGQGLGVVEYDKKSAAAKEIKELTKEIKKLLGEI